MRAQRRHRRPGRDGVVAWQACQRGLHGSSHRRGVKDIEVSASHLGMGWNRDVLGAVANELARPVPAEPTC